MQLRLQLRAIASFGTKLRVCESQNRDPPVFFLSARPFHGACQGLGGLPRGPMGMWGMTRPARETDTGDGPGSASGAGVAGATSAAVCGPERGMACNVHQCRKHRCTGSGMGRHPIQAHPTHDARTAHTIRPTFYHKLFQIKASRGGMRPTGSKAYARQFLEDKRRL